MNPDVSRLVDPQTAAASRASQGRLTHIGFAHDEYVGVKHSSTLFFSHQREIFFALCALRLSRIT